MFSFVKRKILFLIQFERKQKFKKNNAKEHTLKSVCSPSVIIFFSLFDIMPSHIIMMLFLLSLCTNFLQILLFKLFHSKVYRREKNLIIFYPRLIDFLFYPHAVIGYE